MKKLLSYILILTIATGIISSFSPYFVQADIVCKPPEEIAPDGNSCITPYHFLAPLPGQEDFNPTGEGGGDLGKYLNVMIKLFIGICAVLAVIMIVIGGLEYMTNELVSEKADGKNKIKAAVFGLILALGAWTLLYTINPDLLDTSLSGLKNVTVEVVLEDSVPQTAVGGKYKNGSLVGEDWTGTPSVLVGASVSPGGDCAKVGQQHCTSLKGLNVSTLNIIKSKCPTCEIVVTGGTEFWLHGGASGSTTHQKGSATVDLRINTNLNNYIRSGEKTTPNRWTKDGISYLFEGDHWHAGR
jgi:hypothetical protein